MGLDLSLLNAQVAAAKGIKIEVSADEAAEFAALEELDRETQRIKAEHAKRLEGECLRARYIVATRMKAAAQGDIPLAAWALPDHGVWVIRAPSAAEQKMLRDGARSTDPDAAEMTYAASVVEYPDRERANAMLLANPLLVATIANRANELGGLRQAGDLSKSCKPS